MTSIEHIIAELEKFKQEILGGFRIKSFDQKQLRFVLDIVVKRLNTIISNAGGGGVAQHQCASARELVAQARRAAVKKRHHLLPNERALRTNIFHKQRERQDAARELLQSQLTAASRLAGSVASPKPYDTRGGNIKRKKRRTSKRRDKSRRRRR